jgi:outer membrane lipoprotein-sorting protein
MNSFVMKTLFFLLVSVNALAALTGKEIMTKNDEARSLDNCVSHAKLVTWGGGSVERTKEFTWWRKLSKDKVHFNTLTRFLFPPEVRGEGILFLEHDQGKNDIQLYLPNFKKIRRIETDQQSSSFMGSEFSYSDIVAPHVDDYEDKFKKEEACPTLLGQAGGACYVVEFTPATDQVKEQTGSAGGTAWVRKDNFMIVKAQYNDLQGKLWKVLETGDIKEVDSAQHKWMALKVRMENLNTQHFTSLVFNDVKVSATIPDSTFTNQNLSKEK